MIGIFEGEGRSPEIDAFGRTARASDRASAAGHISRATLFILKSRKAHSVRAARPSHSHFRSRRTEGRADGLTAHPISRPHVNNGLARPLAKWSASRVRNSRNRQRSLFVQISTSAFWRSNNTLFLSWEAILCHKSRVRQHCVKVSYGRRLRLSRPKMFNSLVSLRTASYFFHVKISAMASSRSVPSRTSISAEANKSYAFSRWYVDRGVRSLDWGQQHRFSITFI